MWIASVNKTSWWGWRYFRASHLMLSGCGAAESMVCRDQSSCLRKSAWMVIRTDAETNLWVTWADSLGPEKTGEERKKMKWVDIIATLDIVWAKSKQTEDTAVHGTKRRGYNLNDNSHSLNKTLGPVKASKINKNHLTLATGGSNTKNSLSNPNAASCPLFLEIWQCVKIKAHTYTHTHIQVPLRNWGEQESLSF